MTTVEPVVDDSMMARNRLYEIMSSDGGFDSKAERALALGAAYLDVDTGYVAHVEEDLDYWETIASTGGGDDYVPGEIRDLSTNYCRRTVQADDSIALHEASEQGWDEDPAYERHGLECYHGTAISVDGELFGTVCFVAEAARDPFTHEETLFAELIARLLEHELERDRYTAELAHRSTIISVLSRALRHNIRNDLTVVRGYLDALGSDAAAAEESFDPPVEVVDGILDLAETARHLERLVNTDFDYDPVDLPWMLDRVVADVADAYPAASITVEAPESLSIEAMPSLEAGLREVVANAAAHAGPAPEIVVEVVPETDTVDIEVHDDGPGLPEMERAVLGEGRETPLVHGSGLGLWLVYWVATSHGGSVDADVSENGTTVTLTIPRGRTLRVAELRTE